MMGLTREEAVSHLTSLDGQVTLIVQYRKEGKLASILQILFNFGFFLSFFLNYLTLHVCYDNNVLNIQCM